MIPGDKQRWWSVMQEKIGAYVWGYVLLSEKGRIGSSEIRKGYVVMRIRSGVFQPKRNNGGMGCGCGKACVRV
jgi:hypothetical protein